MNSRHIMGGTISLKANALLSCSNRKGKMDANGYELTDREKELVRSSWMKIMEKSDAVSIDIFLRIFELIPHAKRFFPFKNAVGEALLKHPYFKGHAMRFFNAVRMTVVNLDAWEVVLIPNLLKLGQQHANIEGFQHDYFDAFRRAMNDVFTKNLGRQYTSETRAGWAKIFALITDKVEEGYFEGQEINRRKSSQQNEGQTNASKEKMCPLDDQDQAPVSGLDSSSPDDERAQDGPDAESGRHGCPVKHVPPADGLPANHHPVCNNKGRQTDGAVNVEDVKGKTIHTTTYNNNERLDDTQRKMQAARGATTEVGNCV